MDQNFKLEEKENIVSEVEAFWAFTSYIIFFLPLLTKYKTNEFVKFHMKQGFALFVIFLIVYISTYFIPWNFVDVILYTIIFIWWCFGVTYVLFGKEKSLPLFGWFARKLL